MALFAALAAALSLAATAGAAAAPPSFTARAALVANPDTGEIVFASGAGRRLPMASITKLMTAIVVLERTRPTELVEVHPVVSTVGESSVYLRPGERISVRDLLAAALIQSANDAAWALAAHVGRGDVDAFVRLMNAKAKALGLADTNFVRPDGLDVAGHYSSARDILKLARVAMGYPAVRALVRRETARIAGGRSLFTWNDLLGSFPGLLGVKTGHTAAAGWCQVAAARQGGVTIYAVILGSPNRAQRNADLAELLEWGLGQYARMTVVAAGGRYASAAIPFSEARLPLVAARDGRAVVRLGRPLVERVVAPAMVALPVRRGERLGEVRVFAGRRLLARRPLVAARSEGAPRFRDRAGWYAGRAFSEAGSMLEGLVAAVL